MSLEQEAKRLLMERLDDCLKVHADLLDSQDIGSIYELQDLAQLHYYLKVEHPFTPAEVEALLSFQDPLEVARWCKEENTHVHSFPICELLNEIRAYERFEPAPKQDESSQTFARFREALASDYFGFREQALSWSRERLFDAAGEIAALSDTFGALLSKYTPVKEEMDFFLQFTHPLQIISRYGPFEDIGQAMKTLYAERENLIDEAFEPPAERSSLRERLQAAIRESSRMGVPDPDKKPPHEKER